MAENAEGGESRSVWWYVHDPALDQVVIFASGVAEPVSIWHGPGAFGIATRIVRALNWMEGEVT